MLRSSESPALAGAEKESVQSDVTVHETQLSLKGIAVTGVLIRFRDLVSSSEVGARHSKRMGR